jgi:hypothetical protein
MDVVEGKRATAMEAIAHPHIAEVRRELVYEGGNWKHLLIIVTDLNLDPAAPGHDSKILNEIIQMVASAAITAKTGYHALVVRNP